MNTQAKARLDLEIGGEIDKLGYQVEGGEIISDAVARLLDPRGRKNELVLKRGIHDRSGRVATLALVPAKVRPQREATMLLFVIHPEPREGADGARLRFDVGRRRRTHAFLDGASLAKIATRRGGSPRSFSACSRRAARRPWRS